MSDPSAATVMLDTLEALGIRYFLGNGGTDFPDIVEAYATRNSPLPVPMSITHENLAMAMAHGYHLASGEIAAVMVHVNVGTANAVCGVMNAARDQVPVLLMAGRTPLGESGSDAARNVFIHWGQESFDQGAMLREYVKWDYELRLPDQIGPVLCRATAIARDMPAGPVYLTLPREHLNQSTPAFDVIRTEMPDPAPDPAALDDLHDRLRRAERPLVITSTTGRSAAGFAALSRFAETFEVPVVEFRPRAISLPFDSPFHAGGNPHPLVPEADLILALDIDVPWLPKAASPSPGSTFVSIGCDPLQQSYPYWGFQTTLALRGQSADVLTALCDRARDMPDRAGWLARACTGAPGVPDSFNFARASRIIADHLPGAVFVNENPLDPAQLRLNTSGRYFTSSPAGGLGWGLGAALGIKLARPDALVVCAVGDGAYQFGGPTPFHHTARRYDLPVLTIIFNNAKWGGVERATLAVHPDSKVNDLNDRPFIDLGASPDYGMICQSCGGAGFLARSETELRDALVAARDCVQSGQQALIDLRIS